MLPTFTVLKGLIMSFNHHTRDGQRQPVATPSLLAACIAMALMPAVSFAASTDEDTVVVDGSFDNAPALSDGQDRDYSVKTTTTGTKLLLVPRDIPQSVSVISQQDKLRVLSHVEGNFQRTSSSDKDAYQGISGTTVNHYSHEGAKLNLLWTPTAKDVLEIDAMQTYTRKHPMDTI